MSNIKVKTDDGTQTSPSKPQPKTEKVSKPDEEEISDADEEALAKPGKKKMKKGYNPAVDMF